MNELERMWHEAAMTYSKVLLLLSPGWSKENKEKAQSE
jgi:hypothetical protein